MSNPLLQFPESKLHLSLAFPALAPGLLWSLRPRKHWKCNAPTFPRRVFTSRTRILQIRGDTGGHILRVGARQQRRSLVHAVRSHVVLNREVASRGGRGEKVPGRHRVFTQLGGAARQLVVGAVFAPGPAPAAPLSAAWRGRCFATISAPL